MSNRYCVRATYVSVITTGAVVPTELFIILGFRVVQISNLLQCLLKSFHLLGSKPVAPDLAIIAALELAPDATEMVDCIFGCITTVI